MKKNYGLVILAGGKGSRLGREKAWVSLNGQNLVERVASRLRCLDGKLVVVYAPLQKKPSLDLDIQPQIVVDVYPGKGPLVGIYSGLKACKADAVFVTACDMPFVNPELVRFLFDLLPGYDAVVPLQNGLTEPLHAVYSSSCLSVMEELIESGERKVESLFDVIKVRYVEKDELEAVDKGCFSFFNINTRKDLKKAEAIAAQQTKCQQV